MLRDSWLTSTPKLLKIIKKSGTIKNTTTPRMGLLVSQKSASPAVADIKALKVILHVTVIVLAARIMCDFVTET
jgi:hypothetical protein